MDILVELITKSGKKLYEEILNIRNIIVSDDRTNPAKFQINEDLSVSEPVKSRKVSPTPLETDINMNFKK